MKHIALLQGINLGSKRRIAMADLRELMVELGYDDVRTHLQSGNVVFGGDVDPDNAAATIEHALAERFDMSVPVVVRTGKELAAVVADNPLPEAENAGSKFHVVFLAALPSSEPLAGIDPEEFLPEQVVWQGRELYVWYVNGLQRSRLARALTKRTADVTATSRNWNTVTKLSELAA